MKGTNLLICILFLIISFSSIAKGTKESSKKLRYKSGKRIDFESLLIEGEKKKADYSVVTGNLGESDFGLLKYRDNFHDFMALDINEDIKESKQ